MPRMHPAATWLAALLPAPATTAALAALGLGSALGLGHACGRLRLRGGWPTAYTRKLFHLAIFTLSALIHLRLGLAALDAFALGVAPAILLALARGAGDPFYAALARESDAPRAGLFVLVPLITTAVGGLLAGLLAGKAAFAGYLVAGWADGAGEPVGRRFGRHPYRVPGLLGVRSVRTLEGSAAVAAVAWFAGGLALAFAFGAAPARALAGGLAIALATAAVEAISPHGLDNLTTILAASLTAHWLI
jgi:phytol kinase